MDLFCQQSVEWFVPLDWDLIFPELIRDHIRNVKDELLDFASEEFVNHGVTAVRLDLSQRGLLGSFNNELVNVGAVHNLGSHIGCCLDRGLVVQAEYLRHIL